jgi:hypothetical protein
VNLQAAIDRAKLCETGSRIAYQNYISQQKMFVPRVQEQEEIIQQQKDNKPRVNNDKPRDPVNDDLAEQIEKLKINRIEQKLTRLEERDRAKRRYERMDYTQIQCYKCNEMGHFANKCEEFKKNRRNNNQRNNNRRVNVIEEFYDEIYENSDDEFSDNEIDNEEIYAYEMYTKRNVKKIRDESDMELDQEEMNKRKNKGQIKPLERYRFKGKIYERPPRPDGKGWQWSHKNKRWFNSLQGLDEWRARGSPRKKDKIYSNVNNGKDNINFEQLLDITKQQAKYIKRMSKINNKN